MTLPMTGPAPTAMKTRQLLSPSVRAAFFDPPADAAGIVRHYTFSPASVTVFRASVA